MSSGSCAQCTRIVMSDVSSRHRENTTHSPLSISSGDMDLITEDIQAFRDAELAACQRPNEHQSPKAVQLKTLRRSATSLLLLQPLANNVSPLLARQQQRTGRAALSRGCQTIEESISREDPRARSKQPPLHVPFHADNQDPRPTSGDARKNRS